MTERFYAGIGSRATPAPVMALMTALAASLEQSGYCLRSGGAAGADEAFESGVESPEHKQIFLPWRGFNGNKSPIYLDHLHPVAFKRVTALAIKYHPAWHNCSQGAQKLHSRNVQQILGPFPGEDVQSEFVVCWTADGKDSGGTGQALRIARDFDIPVYNLGNPEDRIRLWGRFDWEGKPTSALGIAYGR